MTQYSFDSIIVNGKNVRIKDILTNNVTPSSGFEASTFSFIQQWFSANDAFVQTTSGSTGVPKPITITRQQMIASARLTQQVLQFKAGDTALVCLDPEFIAGKMMLVRSFVTDMKIVAVNPSLNPFREIPPDHSIDLTALVPAQIYELLQSDQAYRLNTIKNILVGGAPLDANTHAQLSGYTCRVYATYGMTETVSHVALQPLNGPNAAAYFTPLPGIKIGTDQRGCLEIEVPYLAEKITTNDLVELVDMQHFRWLGRADNIINTGGIKVIPEKVEGKIRMLFDRLKISNKMMISSIPDPRLGNKIIMLVEGEVDLPVETLKQQLKEILAPYEIPKEFRFNVSFVFTKNGKIDRSETIRQLEVNG